VEREWSFRELLGRVREVCLGGYGHQEVPFEMLVEQLQPERSLSHTPLFQVMFTLQNTPVQRLSLPGLALDRLEVESGTAVFDLTLTMVEVEAGLMAAMEYSTDLFNEETIKRMLVHYETLLRSVVAEASHKVSEISLLSAAEEHQLLIEWNDTRAELAVKSVHELFEEQAARTPEAIAVAGTGQQITYAELNSRANQLAHYLRRRGVGAEVAVGVFLERSVDSVAGLLGVLKAGGVYVPLDPAYPLERLSFMMEDSATEVLLTQKRFTEGIPSSAAGVEVICLDRDIDTLAQESTANLPGRARENNLAYVIYTSGSTGIPKGTSITNGALTNYCVHQARLFDLGPSDRVLQFSSLTFDVSFEEILPPLISGSRLVLRDNEIWSAAEFYQKIAEHRLTMLDLPTAYWHLLVQEWVKRPDLNLHEQLKVVVVGGEAILPDTVNLWQQTTLNSVRLLQAYGPTETTIASTIFEIAPRTPDGASLLRVPIGRPIPNTTVYILDHGGRPTAVGVPGELCIGGTYLARGYLNRPDQTAQKFVPNPFDGQPGARLYRTGDLARYLPDGNIEFQGRADDQVKIRGFRVELGEIEAALNQHPALREAALVINADERGDKHLVAYVVALSKQTPTHFELRNYLKERLPAYMLPSAFVTLDELPLSPSGKVNRNALPAPEIERLNEVDFVAPSTPIEELITGIWSQALKIEQVGINDNFFDLGGHSLLLVKVHARLCRELEKQLPLMRLFQYPTIRTLAEFLSLEEAAPNFTSQQSEVWAEKRKQALKRQRRMRVN
jgi:amino acid adenylation domain-containing protein